MNPTMKSGYTYLMALDGADVREDSEIIVYAPTGKEEYIGTCRIDGVVCNVWETDDCILAQTKLEN